jgi:hypothetical protein
VRGAHRDVTHENTLTPRRTVRSNSRLNAALHDGSARRGTRKALRSCPRLRTLHGAVFARLRIERYVKSGRRLAFNNDRIFRRYPELDV